MLKILYDLPFFKRKINDWIGKKIVKVGYNLVCTSHGTSQ